MATSRVLWKDPDNFGLNAKFATNLGTEYMIYSNYEISMKEAQRGQIRKQCYLGIVSVVVTLKRCPYHLGNILLILLWKFFSVEVKLQGSVHTRGQFFHNESFKIWRSFKARPFEKYFC